MRVEIPDYYGYMHVIDSADPGLIGKWFAEKAQVLMSADTGFNHPVSLDIWPATEHERLTIGKHSIRPVTSDSLLELARHILNVSEIVQEAERRLPGENHGQ